jgi:hypothetical protein
MGGRGPPLAVALKQGSTFPTTARRLMEAEEAPASSSAASPSPRLSRRACHPPASPSPRPSALAGVRVPPTSSSSRLLAREDGVPAHAEAGAMEVVGEQGRAPRPARREGSRRRGPRRRALLLHARGGELLRTCSSMRDPVAACWGRGRGEIGAAPLLHQLVAAGARSSPRAPRRSRAGAGAGSIRARGRGRAVAGATFGDAGEPCSARRSPSSSALLRAPPPLQPRCASPSSRGGWVGGGIGDGER